MKYLTLYFIYYDEFEISLESRTYVSPTHVRCYMGYMKDSVRV